MILRTISKKRKLNSSSKLNRREKKIRNKFNKIKALNKKERIFEFEKRCEKERIKL